MNIVLDTNVFVAAGFNRHSHSAAILRAVAAEELILVWNTVTRDETRLILNKIPPLTWECVRHLFTPSNEYADIPDTAAYGLVPDIDDRKFAALAAAARCVLISNDRHLLSVREQLPVQVLSPGEFCTQYMH